ncbi:hypothetical protein [Streptomyces sp. AMCC400023]|uniref:hypothetical protein n=1 Tax=Streptomyces sp. AMCC400023 TaxID=2056258 RepID=UPI001F21B81F|nr:hypothetical protein [Streptomyces sp. AMCC400023]UJV42319.1 hypothetical protein CVT30_22880 [Streptomyces sp. AMCC400023]
MERMLRWSDELASSDVEAIERFLGPRLRQVQDTQPPGSDEHRAAASVSNLLSEVVPILSSYIQAKSLPRFGTAAERSANTERLSRGILLHWNWLVCMAEPWREEPGFDHVRWKRLYIRNAEQQALVERFSQ